MDVSNILKMGHKASLGQSSKAIDQLFDGGDSANKKIKIKLGGDNKTFDASKIKLGL